SLPLLRSLWAAQVVPIRRGRGPARMRWRRRRTLGRHLDQRAEVEGEAQAVRIEDSAVVERVDGCLDGAPKVERWREEEPGAGGQGGGRWQGSLRARARGETSQRS